MSTFSRCCTGGCCGNGATEYVHHVDEVLSALVTVHVVDDAEPLHRSTMVHITDDLEQEEVIGEEQDVHRPRRRELHAAVGMKLTSDSDQRVVSLARSCPPRHPRCRLFELWLEC
jgi:hypothetical protein